jgi:hypothetical protein
VTTLHLQADVPYGAGLQVFVMVLSASDGESRMGAFHLALLGTRTS